MYSVEVSGGTISINKNVIGKIIEEVVAGFNGKVMLSTNKGKVSKRGGKSNPADGMEIAMGAKGIDVRIFIIISFGTSIGRVTSDLIDEIQKSVKEFLGIELNSVAIVVTGLMSKQLAKRNIEVKR